MRGVGTMPSATRAVSKIMQEVGLIQEDEQHPRHLNHYNEGRERKENVPPVAIHFACYGVGRR